VGGASAPTTATPTPEAAPQAEPGASASAAAPPAARLRNLRVAPRRVIDLNVPFEFDSSVLRPESEATLQQLGLAMQSEALRGMRFLVEGHTDAKGAAAYNERLSGLRARAVTDYLVRQGVEGARLQAVGKGSRELLPSEPPLSPAHRRVRIVALD
jgi:outer membrane protein OmpA-like peptidoglycan-associated protein